MRRNGTTEKNKQIQNIFAWHFFKNFEAMKSKANDDDDVIPNVPDFWTGFA